MFGPPGIMARAASGDLGDGDSRRCCPDYGLFPRGLLSAFDAVESIRREKGADGGRDAVLTASAVELSVNGNEDMLARSESARRRAESEEIGGATRSGSQLGVVIDRAADPPRLYGMTELPLDSPSNLRRVFAALATRNTASTLMNDSSSRSHCFAFLTLRVHDAEKDTVQTSRFQFADLAGSERIKDAHGEMASWKDGGEALNGLITNYSLMMLSACARGLVESRRKPGAKFSFRTYMVDLVQLLKESMTGHASTACFVCLSQTPDNLTQSKFALDFGEVFAKLSTKPRPAKARSRTKLVKSSAALLREAERMLSNPGGGGSYRVMRQAQKRDCQQQLDLLRRFSKT
mmetsp:Transcript_47838/g.144696  ORF Transcript_47838/g.144696 Transcript_47838/m.144696 type:complete len:348 (-) Transcript_47838:2931-3974(-)